MCEECWLTLYCKHALLSILANPVILRPFEDHRTPR